MLDVRLLKTLAVFMFLLLLPLRGEASDNNDSFVSECANVVAIKSTVEEYVKTIKARLRRGSREYMQIEDDYSRASEAYEGFVRSLEGARTSPSMASEAQQETKRFIERCKTVLRVDHLTDLEDPQYGNFVSTFVIASSQKRKTSRTEWIRAIQKELSWSAWDRIR
jgi:preprotein translocase subunit Sss1